MRIQHNIMAMNAYRNYNNNTSALSKNLEKLSSGYKINRAGDDAAGLAISEKMRAQITGLEAAQKNVKDGISLVKTAEGAMQEIQDMLNRMDYLATQSANGTYDNEVDRAALQKEVDQLKSEINRIADSANFNGIKLLDGSLDTSPSYSMTDISGTGQASGAFSIVGDGQLGNDAQAGIFSYDLSQFNLTVKVGADGTVSAQSADGDIVALTDVYRAGDDGIAVLEETPTTGANSKALEFTFGKETISIDLSKLGIDTSKEGVYTLTGSDIIGELTTQLQEKFGTTDAGDATTTGGGTTGTTGGNTTTTGTTGGNTTTTGTTGSNTTTTGTTGADASALNAADPGITAYAGNAGGGGWSTDKKLAGSGLTFSNNGTTLTVTMNSAPSEVWSKDIDMTLRLSTGSGTGGVGNGGEQFAPTVIQEPIDSTKSRQYAQATIDLSKMTMKDGATIQLGDTTYTFAIGKDSKFKDADNVIDLTDFTAASFSDATVVGSTDGGVDVTAKEVALTAASNRFSKAAQNNGTFLVGSTTQGVITLTEREGAVDYAKNNLAGANGLGTKGTDSTATPPNGKDTNVDATVNDWKGLVKFGNAVASGSSALTLQIGDTSDDYNQLKVKVGDMHTSAMGIADLDISNQEGAAAAIETIRNAINYVSSVRGDLGATQNRLEHTQNNLSVMAENIQDAESTIRDTDVAEEMMSYVKNNILVQSAQAMLAQANQVPQGVLQLLG